MGVYSITHVASGKRYIGSSVDIEKRFIIHKCYLRKGTHRNRKLQNAWNKYGEDAFLFHVLDYCEDEEELISWEQQWMDTAKPWYNIRKQANSNLGLRLSKEARIKIANSKKGNNYSLGKPQSTIRSINTSGYIGVHYNKRDGKWVATLNHKHVGQSRVLEEAVRMREKAVQELARVKKGEREEVKTQAVQSVRQTVCDSGSSEVLFSQVSVA